MIHQKHRINGEQVSIFTVESESDYDTVLRFNEGNRTLAFDTESTGLNMYDRDWRLRTFQFGDSVTAFVIPVEFADLIERILDTPRKWIAHNAPFDARCVDAWRGKDSGLLARCYDTYLYSHVLDSRSKFEGGTGHGLKDLCDAYISPDASEGEKALNKAFKEIEVPLPGQVYKSGKRKGQQKYRKAHLSEGWRLIETYNPTYTLYAGLDPILTMRLWRFLSGYVRNKPLLGFEHRLMVACDTLQRRGFRLDVDYAEQLSTEMEMTIEDHKLWADWFGCSSVYAPKVVASALIMNGAQLTERTKTGQPKVDAKVLQKLRGSSGDLGHLVEHILSAKQKAKRKAAYVDTMLAIRDRNDRVHANVNSLRARTARMSIDHPPLQQLPAGEWEIRRCLIADPGMVIVAADLDQVEMRVAAAFAGEEKMIEAAKAGVSIHHIVASEVFGEGYTKSQYKFAKNLGFGTIYGGGADTLSRQAEVSLAQARLVLSIFRERFPKLAAWKRKLTEDIMRQALTPKEYRAYQSLRQRMFEWDASTEEGRQAHEYLKRRMLMMCRGKTGTITTPIGRTIHVDASKAYAVVNYTVQSHSRDILAKGFLKIMNRPALARSVLVPVHDEVVGQARERHAQSVADAYAECLTTSFRGVPITAQGTIHGPSWGHGYMPEEVKRLNVH